MKSKAMLMALLALAFQAQAVPVTQSEATDVASGWLQGNAHAFGEMGAFQSAKAETDASGATLWWWAIFEKGALVVAPDTEIEPVVAVLPRNGGSLPEKHPMRILLERDLTQRLAYAKSLQAAPKPSKLLGVSATSASATSVLTATASKWERLKARVRPAASGRLLKLNESGCPATIVSWLPHFRASSETDGTTLRFWNQDASVHYFSGEHIFDLYTPEIALAKAPCGCVATAGATVLNYFYYNGTSQCVQAYHECEIAGVGKTNLCTMGGPYDWSLIPPRGPFGETVELTPEALDLLGRVAYDVGVCSHMSYGPEGSGAFTFDLAYALRQDFGLASARTVNEKGSGRGNVDPIKAVNYEKLVYNQIRGGVPVIFGISSTTAAGAGHEVVACGYGFDDDEKRTDYTYIFTGWGGVGDAWYALPNIDTKATAGGSSATYDVIGDMITQLSADGRSVPLVGRVTDMAGQPVANAWVWLENGSVGDATMVQTDANGYWRIRVSPTIPNKVVYDPNGQPHSFTVGETAYTPEVPLEGSVAYVAAADLAAALPDVLDFTVDTTKLVDPTQPGFISFQGDYARAARQALAEGKLLYVFGCQDGKAIADYMTWLQQQDEAFRSRYVFLRLDSIVYDRTGIAKQGIAYATVDPRLFDPATPLEWEDEVEYDDNKWVWVAKAGDNGAVADPDAWDPSVCTAEAAHIDGPNVVMADEVGEYVVYVKYSGAETAVVLDNALVTWQVDDGTLAEINDNGLLTPKVTSAAQVTVSALAALGTDELKVVATKTVVVGGRPLVVLGGCRGDILVVPADPADAKVGDPDIASEIAQKGNVFPSFDRPEVVVAPSNEVTVSVLREVDGVVDGCRFRSVRPMVLTGDVVRAEALLPMNVVTNDGKVTATFVPEAPTNYVQWVWETGSCRVTVTGRPGTADVDCEEVNWVDVGATLPVDVTLADPEKVAVWTGVAKKELTTTTNASVRVGREPRTVDVFAQATNVAFTVAKGTALAVGPGFALTLVEAGETEDWYVVNEGDPTPPEPPEPPEPPTPAWDVITNHPAPIAFQSIVRVSDTEWALTITSRVEYCNYRLLWTEDLSKGFVNTGAWEQAVGSSADPVWTTNVITTGGAWFWRAEGADGTNVIPHVEQ